MRCTIAASVLLALAMQGAAIAQPTQTQREAPNPGARSTSQRVTTQEFLNRAWNMNNFEIQAGQEAANKAPDAGFKDFAQMIVADHTKMQAELRSIMRSTRGVELPTAADAEYARKLKQLGAAAGAAFEREFRTQQIQGHQEAIRIFQNYAASGDNQDLKKFAQNSVAILQRHLQRAEELERPEGVM
jgi:putative membrane protein